MILLYSKPDCPACERVKRKLRDAGLSYEEYDVTTNEEALRYIIEVLGAKAVPVVEVDDHETDPIIGYHPEKVQALIELYSVPTVYGEGAWLH